MAKLTFAGGLHLYDGKELSKAKPIRDVRPGQELIFPLQQHIGVPTQPVVAKGERVLAGQKIAESGAFVSAPIYSSVSGTVKEIAARRTASGAMEQSIVVTNDGLYEKAAPFLALSRRADREEILARIRQAGIVGMGGAGFPTHVKLSPREPEKIEYVIANCAECEPYLTSDYRRMKEEPEKLVGGLKILLRLFERARGILAVEDNKPDCIAALRRLVKDEPRLSVRALKTKYPQGGERMLIGAVTGRRINAGMLPADAGCVVNNVDTITAVYRTVEEGSPLTERIVTVTGDAAAAPGNFRVKIGTSFRDLLEQAGGVQRRPEKIICGGPMMGVALYDLDVPVTKTSTALLVFSRDGVAAMEPGPCINCGRCVEACPERLLPTRLAEAAARFDEEVFLKNHGMECCECGCCSYICPAARPLTQQIQAMRRLWLAKQKK